MGSAPIGAVTHWSCWILGGQQGALNNSLTFTRPGGPAPRAPGGSSDGGKARYVFEVMGIGDAKYEREKEKTHRRMERLGRVIRLEGRQFGSARYGLERQLERIAVRIANDLVWRWGES